ncbi:DUF3341 domain-containing protein [Cryomorpha ignava]|uniref:DUF3341 domain-containing protein n=1 Tax=Cryomorpha ignava TaxID=101383 RepID=A0A7K3WK33_9FLAO|nr:DUF3341 domain-containing protein [Cryomorpha ignava]NEN21898.1 DUF3341 domain-containing protein [Cryomorpha ignava]
MAEMTHTNRVIHVMFDDDLKLVGAAKRLVADGIQIKDVYSPFPIHGIDPIIGIKRTRLAIVSFMFGALGLSLALLGMWYFMIYDWPMNIGGKPSFSLIQNLPAFIPISFEFTVLLAAHGMVITYLIRNGTLPGMPAVNPDPRTTDDKFVIEITDQENPGASTETMGVLFKELGAIEINEKQLAKK